MTRKRSSWDMGETFEKHDDEPAQPDVILFPCCKDDGTICGQAGQCTHACKTAAGDR
jgi:hypothetical protein